MGGRRRTPGLRREEVARLADVGVTWYTWLEQGREINASESVLAAIGQALRLDASECDHVRTLAGLPAARRLEGQSMDAIDEPTRLLLDAWEPNPAIVLSARFDLLALNSVATRLYGDVTALPVHRRNLIWLMFTEPRYQRIWLQQDNVKRHLVGLLRAAMANYDWDQGQWRAFLDDLQAASEEFRVLWADRHVSEPEAHVKRLLHPEAGLISLSSRHYWLAPRAGTRLVVFLPVDDEDHSALARLAAQDVPPFSAWSDLTRDGAVAAN